MLRRLNRSFRPVLYTLFALALSCRNSEIAAGRSYTPLFSSAVSAAKTHPPGSIGAAFADAGSAKDLDDAARRWEAFLKRYPPGGETEDAVQKRYIDAAAYELIRVYYLLGRREDGDRLLRTMDPLGLR